MAWMSPRSATVFGKMVTIGGFVLFAIPVVSVYRGSSLPPTVFWGFLLGGFPLALAGVLFGARYGHTDRHLAAFDEETGRVEGHPIGWFVNPVARDNTGGDTEVEPFVPSRPLLAAACLLPSLFVLGFLVWAGGFDGLLLAVAAVLFLGASAVAFVVAELLAREQYDDHA